MQYYILLLQPNTMYKRSIIFYYMDKIGVFYKISLIKNPRHIRLKWIRISSQKEDNIITKYLHELRRRFPEVNPFQTGRLRNIRKRPIV